MPELAEVEYYRRRWQTFHGKKVLAADGHPKARVFREADYSALTTGLTGRILKDSFCHGKQMFLVFSGSLFVRVHLGMTGEMLVEKPDHETGKHDHWTLRMRSATLVFRDPRMFGRVGPTTSTDPRPNLPPAVDDPRFTAESVAKALARRRSAPLKAVLLDQSLFPGIGNWMADEILWRARFHPARRVGDLPPAGAHRLWKETKHVAAKALETIAPDWGDLPDDWLMNHRWESGNTCPRARCHTPLARETIAGRTTCWCSSCQT
ncbi:MAG: Fpg/Nei family DNA glycosylase [Verrucomicrobiales bacterium]